MVQGNKLLYGHVPDPFPPCGMGSCHARLLEPLQDNLIMLMYIPRDTLFEAHLIASAPHIIPLIPYLSLL